MAYNNFVKLFLGLIILDAVLTFICIHFFNLGELNPFTNQFIKWFGLLAGLIIIRMIEIPIIYFLLRRYEDKIKPWVIKTLLVLAILPIINNSFWIVRGLIQ